MTTRELIRDLYQRARLRHGENGFSTRRLKQQLDSMERRRGHSTASMFILGSRPRSEEAKLRQRSEELNVSRPQ